MPDVVERLSRPNPCKTVAHSFTIHGGFGEPLKLQFRNDAQHQEQIAQLRTRGLSPRTNEDSARQHPIDPIVHAERSAARDELKRKEKVPRSPRRRVPVQEAAAIPAWRAAPALHPDAAPAPALAPAACERPSSLSMGSCKTASEWFAQELAGGVLPAAAAYRQPTLPPRDQPTAAEVRRQLITQLPTDRRRTVRRHLARRDSMRRTREEEHHVKRAEAVQRAEEGKRQSIAQARERLEAWSARRSQGQARLRAVTDAKSGALFEAWQHKESRIDEWQRQHEMQANEHDHEANTHMEYRREQFRKYVQARNPPPAPSLRPHHHASTACRPIHNSPRSDVSHLSPVAVKHGQ